LVAFASATGHNLLGCRNDPAPPTRAPPRPRRPKRRQLLEAYLLSGTQPPALAAKVGTAYPEALHDAALRVVRGALLATKGVADGAGGGLLLEAGSYPQMCRQLPAKLLRPCLLQLLELVFDVLASYEAMCAFHEACGPAAEAAAAAAAGRASSSGDEGGDAAPDAAPAAEQQPSLGSDQMAGVHAATRALLSAVGDALRTGRGEVVGAAGAKVRELLLAPDMARGEDFLQVSRWRRRIAGRRGVSHMLGIWGLCFEQASCAHGNCCRPVKWVAFHRTSPRPRAPAGGMLVRGAGRIWRRAGGGHERAAGGADGLLPDTP
jgi:hypothetical protein